jgi:hypothetical protein
MRARLIGNGLLMARVPQPLAAALGALQLQGPDTDALRSLDDAGWNELLRLCDSLQLTLPLALRSCKELPVWVRERLARNLADTLRRFASVQTTYREAAAALAHAGVPQLVLKGFTLSPDYVRAPQFRMQGDIDFYTPREYAARAMRALEGIGYEPANPTEDYRYADHLPTLIRFRGWMRSSNRFDPEMPLALEVHHCLWNGAVFLIQLPEVEEFWTRRINRKLGELSFTALHPVDQLGYFAMHVLRDVFGGFPGMHHTLELATFLHNRVDAAAFWADWQTMHSPHIRQMQAVAFALAVESFSCRLPEAVNEEIQRLPVEQHLWIEMCAGNLLTRAFARNRDGRLLQLLLSRTPEARRQVLWRALSPGTIASPRRVARGEEDAASPPPQPKPRLSQYSEYLASRVSLNGAAVLRFVANGLALWLSSFALRRDTVRQ